MQLLLAHSAAVQRVPGARVGSQRRAMGGRQLQGAVSNGCRCRAFFGKLKQMSKDMGGGKPEDDELYHTPQTRTCYTVEDAKEYYTITGIYAVEGDYNLFDRMVATNADPVDLVLLMACSEGDDGKVEECLNAGAHPDVVGCDGRSAIETATKDEIKQLLQDAIASRAKATA